MAAAMTLKRSHSRSFAGQLGIADAVVAERACKLQKRLLRKTTSELEWMAMNPNAEEKTAAAAEALDSFSKGRDKGSDHDIHSISTDTDSDSIPELDGIVADVDVSAGVAEPSMSNPVEKDYHIPLTDAVLKRMQELRFAQKESTKKIEETSAQKEYDELMIDSQVDKTKKSTDIEHNNAKKQDEDSDEEHETCARCSSEITGMRQALQDLWRCRVQLESSRCPLLWLIGGGP